MPDRRVRKSAYTIDLILLTAVNGQLAVDQERLTGVLAGQAVP